MTQTTVIHVRDMQEGDVYIGRHMRWRPELGHSKWANPMSVKKAGSRELAIEFYRHHITRAMRENPEVYNLSELHGKRLACWCAPKDGFRGQLLCHGQILAGLADGVPPESIG